MLHNLQKIGLSESQKIPFKNNVLKAGSNGAKSKSLLFNIHMNCYSTKQVEQVIYQTARLTSLQMTIGQDWLTMSFGE